jgi:hypothetical protein
MLHLPALRALKSNFIRLNVALFSAVVVTSSAYAVSVAQYNFDGSVATASSVDANATASTFTLNTGAATFVAGNPSTGQAITGSSGWNGADGAKFWEFTVTANSGFSLNLSSLTFDDQKSGTGPTSWTLVINGTTIISSQATHAAIASGNNSVSLTGLFVNSSSVDVKISAFGATSASGTWRVDNVTLNGTVNRGTVSAPDSLPFSFDAMALGGVLLLALNGRMVRLAPVCIRSR